MALNITRRDAALGLGFGSCANSRGLQPRLIKLPRFGKPRPGRSGSNSNGRACSSAPGKEDPYSFSHTQGVTGFDDALTDLQQRLRTLSAESQAPGDPRLQVQGDGKKSSAPQTGPHPDGHALRQPRAGRASSHLFRAQASAAVPVDAAQPQTGAVLPNAAVDGSTARAAPHASASMELLDKPPSPSAESPSTADEESPAEMAKPESSSFNWREQWYPVHRTQDIVEGEPTRVWLFEEPYVILRRPGKPPVALLDVCPHRQAALSEGRMTAAGHLQCAYHGWTFEGESGKLLSIPQVQRFEATPRTCAKALPCIDYQGLIWIYPSPGASPSRDTVTGLPELDKEGWVEDTVVRDMPIDFTLLLENVADPDHGIFAHQTPIFDTYAADRDHPMTVVQEAGRTGKKIVGRVPGTAKLLKKEGQEDKALPGEKGSPTEIMSTLEFEPPCFVRWSRFDSQGTCSFISCFYAVPSETGKCRLFVRYARNIAPWFHPPGWAFNILVNNFLDQDTQLVATQQWPVVGEEISLNASSSAAKMKRRDVYSYRSPTENFLLAVGKWLDDNLPHIPHRYDKTREELPRALREDVLDRYTYHTKISRDSAAAYGFFKTAAGFLGPASLLASAAWLSFGTASFAVGTFNWFDMLRWASPVALLAAGAAASRTLASQFTYVYTREKQRKDLARIDLLVPDK